MSIYCDCCAPLVSSVGRQPSIRKFVYEWLDKHPEATTTVDDGEITPEKINIIVSIPNDVIDSIVNDR